jgi:azurin
MRTRREVLEAAAGAGVLLLSGCGRTAAPVQRQVELHIESDGDFLAFKPDMLSVPAGAAVRLVFHHAGTIITQDHNWVLVFPGMVEAVDQAGQKAGAESGWVPRGDPRVIAATPLCGKGGTVMAEFVAPAPGEYPFFCSNPGHAEDMRGVLHVTPA